MNDIKYLKGLFPKWEKLVIGKVESTYVRSSFFANSSGKVKGHLYVYVDRNKRKVKVVDDYGIGTKEYDVYELYYEYPELEKVVEWAFGTSKELSLSEHVKRKYGSTFIKI
jgi:hypothetical protein